ncbi:MAG TPA: DUF1707 domain-containing protein [Pseudonocardiaceae bacterium]|nr:DUF1707 domain-containing protein [Pseudonocardiaceae bacterium]
MSEDPARRMRISHADREQVLRHLREAHAQGMITADELGERSALAMDAKTRGDIEPLTADLPVAQSTPDAANDVMALGATLGSVTRTGYWVVPRRLRLRSRLGSTELDFTEARIDHPIVDIEIDVKGGSVEMRLPEGASASMDDVDVIAGSIEDHRRYAEPMGRPHFTITGSLSWGSVEIRGPRRNFFTWR